MNAVAEKYAHMDVGALFIYTNEAHPGENFPHLTSMEEKSDHARKLRDRLGVTRRILVDSLDGNYHRAFGPMPNMTWILTKSSMPIYKADWTDYVSVQNALGYFLDMQERLRGQRRAGRAGVGAVALVRKRKEN